VASTATLPTTIQLRPSRLVGLLAAVVALAAAVTWAVTVWAIDSGADDDQRAASAVASREQIMAAYADVYSTGGLVLGASAELPPQVNAAYPDTFGSTGVGGGAFAAGVVPPQVNAAYPDTFGSTGVGGGAFAPADPLAGVGGAGAFVPPQGVAVSSEVGSGLGCLPSAAGLQRC